MIDRDARRGVSDRGLGKVEGERDGTGVNRVIGRGCSRLSNRQDEPVASGNGTYQSLLRGIVDCPVIEATRGGGYAEWNLSTGRIVDDNERFRVRVHRRTAIIEVRIQTPRACSPQPYPDGNFLYTVDSEVGSHDKIAVNRSDRINRDVHARYRGRKQSEYDGCLVARVVPVGGCESGGRGGGSVGYGRLWKVEGERDGTGIYGMILRLPKSDCVSRRQARQTKRSHWRRHRFQVGLPD